jgi:hypothetical protein
MILRRPPRLLRQIVAASADCSIHPYRYLSLLNLSQVTFVIAANPARHKDANRHTWKLLPGQVGMAEAA